MTTVDWSLFIDPPALALVGFGCLFVAFIQNGVHGLASGLASILRLVRPARESERARLAAVIVTDLVERRGVSCADRGPQSCAFTHRISTLMSDEDGYESFSRAVARLLTLQSEGRMRIVRVWNDIADAAPALGMLGTVIGLIQMFNEMNNVEGVGAAMALCLLTSLYGMVLAHLVAGPIARRLQLLGEQEAVWQQDIADRMLALARREYPDRAVRRPFEGKTGHAPDIIKAMI